MDLCCKAQRIQNLSYAQSFPLVPREEQRRYRCKSGRTTDPNQRKGQLKGESASLSHFSISKSCRAPAISAVISRCHSRSARRATKLSRARATLQEEVPPSSYHVTVTWSELRKRDLSLTTFGHVAQKSLLLPRCTPTIARGRSRFPEFKPPVRICSTAVSVDGSEFCIVASPT